MFNHHEAIDKDGFYHIGEPITKSRMEDEEWYYAWFQSLCEVICAAEPPFETLPDGPEKALAAVKAYYAEYPHKDEPMPDDERLMRWIKATLLPPERFKDLQRVKRCSSD